MENLKVLAKNFGGPSSWRWRGLSYFSTLKVQRHQSKAPEQVSKHAYVAALKRCGWLFVEAILFNNVSRVNVVEQIPTSICSTTFSNNNYTCDPRNVSILYPNDIVGPWMSRRGQGRCSNRWKIYSYKILTLLSRNSGTQERKRPGRSGILWNSVEKSLPQTI